MKRLKKAVLLTVRELAYRRNRLRTYYWADQILYELRNVTVMPTVYYHWLYRVSMKLIGFGKTRRLAEWAIHTIPYHVRFYVA